MKKLKGKKAQATILGIAVLVVIAMVFFGISIFQIRGIFKDNPVLAYGITAIAIVIFLRNLKR